MVICPDCGKDVKEAKFCSNCGAVLPPVETAVVVSEPVEDKVVIEVEEEPVEVKTDDEAAGENADEKSMFCPNCGTEVNSNTVFCPQCGFKLHQDRTQTKFCQACGEKININAEICPNCGVRVAGVSASEEKSVVLSAILSFLFPGLGHIYNGLTKKGISFIILYIISAVLVMLLVGIVLMIVVWIWALIDAIKTAEAINRGEFVEDKLF